jgi:hypothetical protein
MNKSNGDKPDKPDYMTLGWVKEQTIKNLNEKGVQEAKKFFMGHIGRIGRECEVAIEQANIAYTCPDEKFTENFINGFR